jgi:hypothetical protein
LRDPHRNAHSRLEKFLLTALCVLIGYTALAYFVLPALWSHYEHQRGLADLPMVTRTAQDIPGDPINVGLIGDKHDVLCAMQAAGWYQADRITARTSIEIAGSVLFNRPYRRAPVSPLFYLGRVEDLAFERPFGRSAHRRHHVRLWQVLEQGEEKRPVWLGSATFDRSVGISRYTWAITHHIASDIDAERDLLTADLEQAGMVDAKYQVTGIGATLTGDNGGGDSYYTDGEVWISRLVTACQKTTSPVEIVPSPLATEIKDQIWRTIANTLGK